MVPCEEFWLEQTIGTVLLDHTNGSRKSVCHVVIVTEYGRAIALPQFLPDTLWVYTTAVDQPLRVVVESNINGKGSALLGAANEC